MSDERKATTQQSDRRNRPSELIEFARSLGTASPVASALVQWIDALETDVVAALVALASEPPSSPETLERRWSAEVGRSEGSPHAWVTLHDNHRDEWDRRIPGTILLEPEAAESLARQINGDTA